MKSSLIILTFNEIEGLKAVFPKIPFNEFDEFFSIDPGSLDGTLDFLKEKKIRVFIQEKRGRGEAFRLGATIARGEILVFFSPDGNENPQDATVLKQAIENGYDMAIASRFMEGGKSENTKEVFSHRDFGNKFFTFLANMFFRGKFTDSINGFRAIKKEKFKEMKTDAPGFDIEYQMSIRALKLKQKIKEIPTIEGQRIGGKSTAKTFPTGLKLLKALLKEIFN